MRFDGIGRKTEFLRNPLITHTNGGIKVDLIHGLVCHRMSPFWEGAGRRIPLPAVCMDYSVIFRTLTASVRSSLPSMNSMAR